MSAPAESGAFAALRAGFAAAPRQWRMLLLWLLASLLPAAVAALPVLQALNATFGQSPHAAAIDAGRNLPLLFDGLVAMFRGDGLTPVATHVAITLACAMLLSPWLCGMLVASLREGRPLRFGELIQGGLREYGRQFRLVLVLAIPALLILGAASLAAGAFETTARTAVLASSARRANYAAIAVTLVAAALVHCVLELSRAQFAKDVALRAAWRAGSRGIAKLLRRPFATALVYLATQLPAMLLAPLAALLVLKAPVVAGWLAVQSVGLLLAGLRSARLVGFARL